MPWQAMATTTPYPIGLRSMYGICIYIYHRRAISFNSFRPRLLAACELQKMKIGLNEVHDGVFLVPLCEEEGQDSIVKEIFEENPFKRKYNIELENFQNYLTLSHEAPSRIKRMKRSAEESTIENKMMSFCEVCTLAESPPMKLLDHCDSYKSIISTSTGELIPSNHS